MIDLIFDIRTPDSAFEFILSFFKITGMEFIDKYIIECNRDIDEFWDRHLEYIDCVDISSLKYKAFHVTSNWNECSEIKKSGIKNLQKVLSEENELTALLLKYGVRFDIENKVLTVQNKTINIDYDKYRGKYGLSSYEKMIERVAHKIYYDFQVNSFFSNNDIHGYGTEIHKRPEFLINLVELIPELKQAEKIWRDKSKGYIVTFLAEFEQFAWYTFFDYEYEYWDDIESKRQLKKWIITKAIDRSFDGVDEHAETFAYMGAATVIRPEQIIEYKEITDNRI